MTEQLSTLDGGGGQPNAGKGVREVRRRTRRVMLTWEEAQQTVFIPQDLVSPQLDERLALHVGCHVSWVNQTWTGEHEVTLTKGPMYPHLSATVRDTLLTLSESMAPTKTERRQWDARDLYLGHRASRAHGLTVATYRYAEALARLNHYLVALLPGRTWNALGVLEHRNIPRHTDILASALTYAISLTEGTGVLTIRSPLTHTDQRLPMKTRVAVFSPHQPHAFSTDRHTRTITLYTTARMPTVANRQRLADLHFPVHELGTAPTPPRGTLSPTPEPFRGQRGDRRKPHGPDEAGHPVSSTTPHDEEPSAMAERMRATNTGDARPSQTLSPDDLSPTVLDTSDNEAGPGGHVSSTSSGLGYEVATTPSYGSDVSESAIHTSDDDYVPNLDISWYADSEEERDMKEWYFGAISIARGSEFSDLRGGGGSEQSEAISKAVQKSRQATQALTKKQLRGLFQLEARTLRRVTESDISGDGKERLKQILLAAAKRVGMAINQTEPMAANRQVPAKPAIPTKVPASQVLLTSKGQQEARSVESKEVGPKVHATSESKPPTVGKPGKGKGSGSLDSAKGRASQAPTRTFCLSSGEWPLATHTLDDRTMDLASLEDGFYMTDNEELALATAFKVSTSGKAIAIVTPKPFGIQGTTPIQSMATLLMTSVQVKGKERVTASSRTRVCVWVYNVSRKAALTKPLSPILELNLSKPTTAVLRVKVPTARVPEDMLQADVLSAAKQEMRRLLGEKDLVDVWGVTRKEGHLVMQVRLTQESKEAFMKRSGFEDLWVETPIAEMGAFTPVWLGKPGEVLDLAAARDRAGKFGDHRGMIQKDYKGTMAYALRVPKAATKTAQETLELDSTLAYTLEGIPPHISGTEVQTLVDKMGRTWKRGMACWAVRAAHEAPYQTAQIWVGRERFWVRLVPARKPQPEREQLAPDQSRTLPQTWAQAARGVRARPGDTGNESKSAQEGNRPAPRDVPQEHDNSESDRAKRARTQSPHRSAQQQIPIPSVPLPTQSVLQDKVEALTTTVAHLEKMMQEVLAALPRAHSGSAHHDRQADTEAQPMDLGGRRDTFRGQRPGAITP